MISASNGCVRTDLIYSNSPNLTGSARKFLEDQQAICKIQNMVIPVFNRPVK